MKVLIVGSECTPLVKVGGLGDVVGALPKALEKEGIEIAVCIPFYDVIDREKYRSGIIGTFSVEFHDEKHEVKVFKTLLPDSNVPVYLLENREFFGGGQVYFSANAMASDVTEIKRFAFFSKAVVEMMLSHIIQVDVVHCNDYHTAFIPNLLQSIYANKEHLGRIASVFTIHNLANQGIVDLSVLSEMDVEPTATPQLSFDTRDGDVDFILQGVLTADVVNAVSPTYAKEIMTPEFGEGIHHEISLRKKDLYGILNGIDTGFFNPETDKNIAHTYSIYSWREGKALNKRKLQQKLGLDETPDIPVFGMVTRLAKQKGLDLVVEAATTLAKEGEVVILGVGEPEIERQLQEISAKHPKRIGCQFQFNASLAQQIYAGSDFFLMPSRFEPCGLGHLIAMRDRK